MKYNKEKIMVMYIKYVAKVTGNWFLVGIFHGS